MQRKKQGNQELDRYHSFLTALFLFHYISSFTMELSEEWTEREAWKERNEMKGNKGQKTLILLN